MKSVAGTKTSPPRVLTSSVLAKLVLLLASNSTFDKSTDRHCTKSCITLSYENAGGVRDGSRSPYKRTEVPPAPILHLAGSTWYLPVALLVGDHLLAGPGLFDPDHPDRAPKIPPMRAPSKLP